MSNTPNYVEWRPEYDGHAPPNWREGMLAAHGALAWSSAERYWEPSWHKGQSYKVEPEAITAPKEDVVVPGAIQDALHILRQYPADELAKHGITLAPEKDWATELWADLLVTGDFPNTAETVREGRLADEDRAAIALIRERVVLKEGV